MDQSIVYFKLFKDMKYQELIIPRFDCILYLLVVII